ncbi:MAG: hypothetical protein M3X11_10580 [Acidobacteriota bacterium]|nr:hypothetical protein [Acidobacteriota bacterium]
MPKDTESGKNSNVLALRTAENASLLLDRVQCGFYQSQKHDGVWEGAMMVSPPGYGLSAIEV